MAADNRAVELIVDLEAQLVACLMSVSPLKRHEAIELSKRVSGYLTKHWGGQQIYIPKNQRALLADRDRELFAKFNGRNHAALAKEYGLTMTQVYNIVRIAAQAYWADRQEDLFV